MTEAASTRPAVNQAGGVTARARRRPAWVRLARIIALAVIVGVGVNHVWWSIADWHLSDMNAYWDAGMRIRHGEALYPPVSDAIASDVFRYSPWFAWLWTPITFLPRELVNVAWSAVLLAASAAALWPMMMRRAWIAVAFFLPILVGISAIGNVHPILIAGVVLTADRRSGPAAIGVAASLKLFPFLFVLTYIGRRQWTRAAITVLITATLLVPYLFYDLTYYVTSTGGTSAIWDQPIVYAVTVAAAAALALYFAKSRNGWLTASATVVLALPRFFVYDVTWIMAGLPRPAADSPGARKPGA